MVKVQSGQCPSSARVPSQGKPAALGGSVPPGRGRPTGRPATASVRRLQSHPFLAFDHPGAADEDNGREARGRRELLLAVRRAAPERRRHLRHLAECRKLPMLGVGLSWQEGPHRRR
eukprot:scaffold19443_cov66-Phaeocystis_antarctica.AAC.1